MHMYASTGIGFNMTEYVLREGSNRTLPVVITGGSVPVDTQVKVNPNFDTAGKRFMNMLDANCRSLHVHIS